MRLVVLIALGIAGSAAAQPVTDPYRCEVTIIRAPDDVRAVIESWLGREPRCTSTLELRVIPTEGALYLIAHDGRGRVRERVVPDAESVGALVVSWIADEGRTEEAEPRDDEPAPPPIAAPGVAPSEPVAIAPGAPPIAIAAGSHRAHRWLTFAGMGIAHGAEGGGLRLELDTHARGRWSVSAGLAATQGAVKTSSGDLDLRDARATVTLAHTLALGRWQLRLSAGVGVMYTRARGYLWIGDVDASGMFPTSELSMQLARRLGSAWAVTAGPMVTWYAQTYRFDDMYGIIEMERRDADVMVLAGLRRRM